MTPMIHMGKPDLEAGEGVGVGAAEGVTEEVSWEEGELGGVQEICAK
jgi:hypothetical protein